MQSSQQPGPSLYDIITRLDAYASCDPEFDAVYEDLDREFGHLRLHLNDGGDHA
jgi:hypothetical protein